MMKSILTRATIIASILVSPSLALAMTAEETFAFIIFNVQDGDTFVSAQDGGLSSVKVTGKQPLTYKFSLGNGDQATFAIAQSKPCVFDVVADLGEVGKPTMIFDMNKLVGLPILPSKDELVFANECAIRVVENGRCLGADFRPGMFGNVKIDRERTKRAIDYFKKEFCAGSPF